MLGPGRSRVVFLVFFKAFSYTYIHIYMGQFRQWRFLRRPYSGVCVCMARTPSWRGLSLGAKIVCVCVGMVLVWCRYGVGMVLVCWYGVGMAP